MNPDQGNAVAAQLARLTDAFFRAVSFARGTRPSYADIYGLFIESGLLIKNVGSTPEICSVAEFIRPRQASVDAGHLTEFHEQEIAEVTVVFGNIAHRFSSYSKRGTVNGVAFSARGMISTQFVNTPVGWKMSAMAWDDERPGLALAAQFEPART
jgi:hypothetical protein